MITKKVGDNYICYDEYLYENKKILRNFIKNDCKKIFEEIWKNIILVLGWDWTLLRTIKKYHKKNMVFLAINFWTRWVLMNNKEKFKNLLNYKIHKYPLLEVSYEIENKKYCWVCFNEVNITVWDGKVLDLEVFLEEEKYFLRWDWVIISTPAGSTWYNKSLFWPILNHQENKFIMTPKADIDLQKSVIFDNGKKVLVQNINRLNPIEIYIDWNKLGKNIRNKKVKIKIKKSNIGVRLMLLET